MNKLTSLGRRSRWALLAAIVGVVGCASDEVSTSRFSRPVLEAHPVSIVAVDGLPVTAGSASLMPGLRKVTVQMPRAAGFAENDRRTIDLEVKACTNYWLVASRDVRVSAEYEIKVDHERRVYNCQPPATPTVAAAPATPASTPTAVTPAASAATK